MSIERTVVRFHLPPCRTLGNFVHPTLPLSLLPDVNSMGSKISHTGGKGNLSWPQRLVVSISNPLILGPAALML